MTTLIHTRTVDHEKLAALGYRVKDVDPTSGIVLTITDDFMTYPVDLEGADGDRVRAALRACIKDQARPNNEVL